MYEFFFESLRKPAHGSWAGAMRQFRSSQVHSFNIKIFEILPVLNLVLEYYRGFVRKGDRVLGYNIIVVAKRY